MAPQNVNAVFYATTYHPIQAGSIDGTDTASHDNGVYRALLASSTGLYDPAGDPKAEGDPYNTLFVGRLAHHTTEMTLHQVMSNYGRIRRLRLVRHVVTGASSGYAFVEFETQHDMEKAYEVAQNHIIDGSQIMVDYNRQQLMTGWIPRRLGGGLGGRKESGQLRFGGRDRPFRAPLRPIPHEELTKLGIPLPPAGRYMSRFQLPPIPQRSRGSANERSHYKQRSSSTEPPVPPSKATLLLSSETRDRRLKDNERNAQQGKVHSADLGFSPSTRGKHQQQQQQQQQEDITAREGSASDQERRHRHHEHPRKHHHRHKKHRDWDVERRSSSEHEDDERVDDRQREVLTSDCERRESSVAHRRHEGSTSSRSGHEGRDYHESVRYEKSPSRSSTGQAEREPSSSRHHRHERRRRTEPRRSTVDDYGGLRSPKHDDNDDNDKEAGKKHHNKRKRRDE